MTSAPSRPARRPAGPASQRGPGAAGALVIAAVPAGCGGVGPTAVVPSGSLEAPSTAASAAPSDDVPTVSPSDPAGWTPLVPADDPWASLRPYGDPDAAPGVPDGWAVEGDELHALAGGGPDLATRETYGEFELELTWRVAPGGNGGVLYRVTETDDPAWWTGPEYQLLDDERHPDGGDARTSAGSLYALIGPSSRLARPAGEPNQTRIVVRDGWVEHWLNGTLAVAYDWRGQEVLEAIAGSKFGPSAGFMAADEGRIVLQHHGEEAWYAGARIRRLDAEP